MRNHVEEILKKGRSKEVFVCLLYFFCLHLIIFLLCFSFLQKSSTNSSDEYQIDSLILCLVVVSLVWNILLFLQFILIFYIHLQFLTYHVIILIQFP